MRFVDHVALRAAHEINRGFEGDETFTNNVQNIKGEVYVTFAMAYSSFQLGEQISTAEDAKGRRGWLIILKLCVPLRPGS